MGEEKRGWRACMIHDIYFRGRARPKSHVLLCLRLHEAATVVARALEVRVRGCVLVAGCD